MLAEWAASLVPRSASWTYWWQWFISESYWDKIKTTWRLFLAFLDRKLHACLLEHVGKCHCFECTHIWKVSCSAMTPRHQLGCTESRVTKSLLSEFLDFRGNLIRNVLICLRDSIKYFREKSFLTETQLQALCVAAQKRKMISRINSCVSLQLMILKWKKSEKMCFIYQFPALILQCITPLIS